MAKIPARVGKYKIDSLLAKGGMGSVYKATHPTLKRSVVLKRLTRRGSADFTERFRREARIMMGFKNEHIVHVHDHFKEGSSYYIVSEYVDGVSLEELIRRERYLPNDVALLIVLDCCKALQYAHSRGVVHRDIKPANILISKRGEIKLTDFGIAVSSADDDVRLTRAGMTLGTPSYMAPEQFENARAVDARADVYSLGITLYETVTGKRPFPNKYSADTLALIQKGKYTPAKKINPKVNSLICRLIRRCTKVRPKRRFRDLLKLIRLVSKHLKTYDIRLVRERLVKYVRQEKVPEIKRPASGFRRVLLAALVLLLISLGGLAYVGYINGYHYEILWPREYGSLVVVAKIRRGIRNPQETFLTVAFFYDDGAKIPRVENVSLTFRENRAKESNQHFVLETPRVFLESGHYRAKIQLENNLYWKTFYLAPREIQKRSLGTYDAQRISVDLGEVPPRQLNLRYRVFNQVNGQDITEGTIASLLKGTRWIELDDSVLKTLTTDSRYHFRFSKAGFYSKDYDLVIAAEQTTLDLGVSLIPKPGRVRIRSNHDGLKLLLDNFSSYLSGGENRRRMDLQPSSAEVEQEMILSPGEYSLSAVYSPSIREQIKFYLETNDTIEVLIRFNPESESIGFEILE